MSYRFTCPHCGKDFEAKDKKRKFCSKPCFDKAQTTVRHVDRPCKGCGRPFRSPYREQVYCSDGCRRSSQKEGTRRTCARCGKVFWRSRGNRNPAKRGAVDYCSRECQQPGAVGKLKATCLRCGKEFECYRRNKNQEPLYCSWACWHPDPPKPKSCEQCGQEFSRKHRSRYCSKACQFEAAKDSVEITCKGCGAKFMVPRVREETAGFCSRRCFIRTRAETYIERLTRLALDRLGIEYLQEWRPGVRNYAIDFYIPSLNVAIEVDGHYWHTKIEAVERDLRKDRILTGMGIRVIRLPANDIMQAEDLASLIAQRLSKDSTLVPKSPRQQFLFGVFA